MLKREERYIYIEKKIHLKKEEPSDSFDIEWFEKRSTPDKSDLKSKYIIQKTHLYRFLYTSKSTYIDHRM